MGIARVDSSVSLSLCFETLPWLRAVNLSHGSVHTERALRLFGQWFFHSRCYEAMHQLSTVIVADASLQDGHSCLVDILHLFGKWEQQTALNFWV